MAETYRCRPSSLLDIVEPYDAYCFDEACAYIRNEIKNKKEPNFSIKNDTGKSYTSFSDMYRDMTERGVNVGDY